MTPILGGIFLCLTLLRSVHYTRQPILRRLERGVSDIDVICLPFPRAFLVRGFPQSRLTSPYFLAFYFGLLDNFCLCAATQVGKEVPFLNTTRRPYASTPNRASESALPKDTRPDRSPTPVLTPPDSA